MGFRAPNRWSNRSRGDRTKFFDYRDPKDRSLPLEGKASTSRTPTGYVTLISLSWRTLGLDPKPGLELGTRVTAIDRANGRRRDARVVVEALKEAGWSVRYSEIPNANHVDSLRMSTRCRSCTSGWPSSGGGSEPIYWLPMLPADHRPPIPSDFDRRVEGATDRFGIPGLGVAIVRRGEVVHLKGYGFANVQRATPADERTVYSIASNTKAITATALAILVDEGKLGWDDPVVKHLPGFALSDPYVTREITVRDLLVHRSGLGLGAGDLMLFPSSTYTRDEVIERLRYLPLATSFRSAYAYDNVLYVVAGKVLEIVSGVPWADFVRDRILRPIGMRNSAPTYGEAARLESLAQGYEKVGGVLTPVEPETNPISDAGGGVFSCADDMARWMLTRLAKGRVPGGDRIYSEAQAKELTTIVTPMPVPEVPQELEGIAATYVGYALGLAVSDYRGHRLVTHTGALSGFTSEVSLLPGSDTGIAILTNGPRTPATLAIRNLFLDWTLDAPPFDWLGFLTRQEAEHRAQEAKRANEAAHRRNRSSKPHLPLARYAGDYEDAWYGRVTIRDEGGDLVMRFGRSTALVGTLEHWQYESFLVRWHNRALLADAFVTFTLTHTGEVAEARMLPASPDVDFSFDFQDLRLRRVEDATERL